MHSRTPMTFSFKKLGNPGVGKRFLWKKLRIRGLGWGFSWKSWKNQALEMHQMKKFGNSRAWKRLLSKRLGNPGLENASSEKIDNFRVWKTGLLEKLACPGLAKGEYFYCLKLVSTQILIQLLEKLICVSRSEFRRLIVVDISVNRPFCVKNSVMNVNCHF